MSDKECEICGENFTVNKFREGMRRKRVEKLMNKIKVIHHKSLAKYNAFKLLRTRTRSFNNDGEIIYSPYYVYGFMFQAGYQIWGLSW